MGYGCMGDFYWEIEHIPDWNVIVKELPTTFSYFKKKGSALFIARNAEQIQYVNEKSLARFENLFNILLETLNRYECQTELPPINQWILMGAVAEVTLQIILAVYYSDYLNERWQQWMSFDDKYIIGVLNNVLEQETEKGELTSKQRKSIAGAIADKIGEHTKEHPIDRIMLDELIQFAEKTKMLCNDTLIVHLRTIQRNRNCIHAFSERVIDDWDVLRSSVNALGYIWDDFGYRFTAENTKEPSP